MPTPSSRSPVIPGRGTLANLNSSLADIADQELLYRRDVPSMLLKRSGVLETVSKTVSVPLLSDLNDVDLTSGENDGQTLTYYNGEWVPGAVIGGVQYSSPTDDPYYDNVVSLLHMDGANNGTTFVDSSKYNKTYTLTGAPVTSTAQSVFGGSSGYFNGSSRLTIPAGPTANPQFDLRTPSVAAKVTVECWARFTSLSSSDRGLWSIMPSNSFFPYSLVCRVSNTQLFFGGYRYPYNGDQRAVAYNFTFNLNQWYHIVCMTGTQAMYIYVDGVRVASSFSSGLGTIYGFHSQETDLLQIGDIGGNSNMLGYIDDFRMTIGTARYGASYTVPTVPYPDTGPVNIPYTVTRLSDVDTTTVAPVSGQRLVWDNSNWVPGTAKLIGAAPATASDTGAAGQMRYDAGYLYVCTAADTWQRVGLSTW